MDVTGEHQDLLQFLYSVPVGLVHASEDGKVELINSAAARWLMPISRDGRLENLFTLLEPVAPGLRAAVADHGTEAGTVVDSLRVEVMRGRRRGNEPEFVAMTLSRLDNRRLMAVFNDVTEQVRNERALGDSAAHYRAVVSVLSEGIVLHDATGRLLMCNAAAERIVGAPLPALQSGMAIARGWAPHWPDGRPMAPRDSPTGKVLSGEPAQERVPVITVSAAGERRWFEVSAQPVVRPGTTELLAVVTSFTDVTQRQALQEQLLHHREHLEEMVAQRTRELEAANAVVNVQQKLMRVVADAVPALIAYWDAELRCQFSNKAHLEWFGKAPEAMAGIRMQDLLGEALFAASRTYVEAALRGQAQHFQQPVRRPDGAIGHTLTSYIPDLVDGKVRGFNVVISDVTELKQAELRLEDLNRQLQQQAWQADQATRAKSAFLANMSHEIRTPMNAIVGLSHLMQRELQEPLQQARLQKINAAAQHLLQLINEVLDLSKIEAGKMALDDAEFATRDVLARALGMVSLQAREKGLDLVVDGDGLPPQLQGDEVRLSQCLINLLANAVKFTERGWVRLRGEELGRAGRRVRLRFEVQDSGPGIAVDRQALLFSAFEQADNSATRRHGGSGLGLALTRHFARLMGGDAGVNSTPGAGSTFWFTVELGLPESAPAPAPWLAVAASAAEPPGPDLAEDSLRRQLAGRRVLLAEDNPINQEVALELLELVGLVVDTADDGARALELARTKAYDIVLMDVQMPGLDGLVATRAIRDSGIAVPIVAMTANAFAEERAECLAAGMDDHLAKPIDPAALYGALLRWLPAGVPGA